jgi:hypothetical protein
VSRFFTSLYCCTNGQSTPYSRCDPGQFETKTAPELQSRAAGAGAYDRDIEKYFAWEFYTEAEDRSLDHLHEMIRREEAGTGAVMTIKLRLLDAGIFIRPTAHEHFLRAADFWGWAETETDPKKKAELISLGNLSEGLARVAHLREVEAKAKRPARKRWPRS